MTSTVQPSGSPVTPRAPGSLQKVTTGEFVVSASAQQLPDVPGNLVRLRARSTNTGAVYVGPSAVTAPDGTTTETAGFPLLAGDDSGWMPLDNLNHLHVIGENTTDSLLYIVI